jgi:preprotein translocase subunit SecB
MAAAFNFDSYRLNEIVFKKSQEERPSSIESKKDKKSSERNLNFNVTTNIAVSNKNTNKYRMEFIVRVEGGVEAKISLFGYFSGTGFYSDTANEQQELLPIGIALLLPIARSILANISAQDGSTPIMIPTVNVQEVLDHENCWTSNPRL